MPDLTVGSDSSSHHNLIRVNSTTLNSDHNNAKPTNPISKTTYLVMENTPISIGVIFNQLNNEVITILGQYFSMNLIKNLLVGRPISRIQIIQPFIISEDKKISLSSIQKTLNDIFRNWIKDNKSIRKKEKQQ